MIRVHYEKASKQKMSHAFIHGMGYVYVGPLQVRNHVSAGLKPPPEADHGSLHWVMTPQGARLQMRWDKVNGVWEHPHNRALGNRLGWTPEYLGSHNWTYKLAA